MVIMGSKIEKMTNQTVALIRVLLNAFFIGTGLNKTPFAEEVYWLFASYILKTMKKSMEIQVRIDTCVAAILHVIICF